MQWSAIGLLTRVQARRQLAALALAALMLTVGGTVTLVAIAGAARTSSAASRAFVDSGFPEVSVDVPGFEAGAIAALGRAPEVAHLGTMAFAALGPADSGLVPGIDVAGVMPVTGYDDPAFDRVRLSQGRTPAPDRAEEVLVNPALARRLKLRVGDRFTVAAFRQSQVLSVFEGADPPAPMGTRREVHIVGIGRDLSEILASDADDFGVIVLSPAWFKEHGKPLADVENTEQDTGVFRLLLRAQLERGEADAERFLARVFDAYGGNATTMFSETRSDLFDDAEATLRVETIALLIFGAIAGIATTMAVAQAVARLQFLGATPLVGLARAVGVSARSRAVATLLPSACAIGAGVSLAAIASYLASGVFPRGLGRRLEPDPGLRFAALPTFSVGALFLFVLVAMAVWNATRVTGRLRAESSAVPRLRLPMTRPEVGIGVRMALHSGRGVTKVPSRQTVVAAVLGITGVVAAVSFGASLDQLLTTPRLYGNAYDTQIVFQGDNGPGARAAAAELISDERVSGLTRVGMAEVATGRERMSVDFLRPEKGSAGAVLLAGRAPTSPNEIAVDPNVVKGSPRIGSAIRVSFEGASLRALVVGHLPGTGFASVIMTEEGAERLGIADYDEAALLVRWRDGVDAASANQSLEKSYAEVYPVAPPSQLENLRRVRSFPYALAGMLGSLAVAAVGHLLLSGVRRRSRDLAVVKAVGYKKRQVRAIVAWQAITVGVLAVALGSIFGVAAGRGAWASVTSSVRVIFAPAIPPVLLGVIAVATLLIAIVISAWPARRAANTPTAQVLRAE